ncbi:MerR family transcriptional regulator [Lysinibacillus sp. NPDC093210]|uniref:MerR family transcriptional regulator n=1 Tax=Lysinibacillus sp. NPDC093210 TaxID=3364133 RepID=UPI00381651DA
MHNYMTIQEFSNRTGISKSTLRFYEAKNLLLPVERRGNGYRIYASHQIAIVKLITTLRIADVPIKYIQHYLQENDEVARQTMMDNWIRTLKKKRELIDVSLRFLESDSIREDIYLIDKNEEKIIWFMEQSTTGKFGEHFAKRANELKQNNIQINSYYVNYLSGQDLIKVQIGFGVTEQANINRLTGVDFIEHMPACICLALAFKEHLTEIKGGYQKLLQYALEHSWVPTRSILEWYRGEDFTQLDLLLPVIQLERNEK